LNGICPEEPLVRFIKHYKGWLIVEVADAYVEHPSCRRLPLLLAIERVPTTGPVRVLTGVDLPDLEADVDEALR